MKARLVLFMISLFSFSGWVLSVSSSKPPEPSKKREKSELLLKVTTKIIQFERALWGQAEKSKSQIKSSLRLSGQVAKMSEKCLHFYSDLSTEKERVILMVLKKESEEKKSISPKDFRSLLLSVTSAEEIVAFFGYDLGKLFDSALSCSIS